MKDKILLFNEFLESLKVDGDQKIVVDAILEASNVASEWYFARDINGDTNYKGNYHLFTDNDDDIPAPARKRFGLLVMPNFASNTVFSTQGAGSPGNASMASYGGV